MSETEAIHSKCRADVSLTQIQKNFRALSQRVGNAAVIPMVKANAYGHGIVEVSKALVEEKALFALGVATIGEAMKLRQSGIATSDASIIVFSQTTALNLDLIQFFAQYKIIPVISSMEDLKIAANYSQKIQYHLKFNTGMNRLGIAMEDLTRAETLIRESGSLPQGVLTHLATAENPKHALSKKQKAAWTQVRKTFKNLSPRILTHFANSGAILENEFWETNELSDMIRPGISLYGIGPRGGRLPTSFRVKPSLSLRAQVLNSRRLLAHDTVGYGATYQAKSPHFMATLGAGYGDGVHRVLSRQVYGGIKILGTVSMDMTTIQTQKLLKPGSWVEILGPKTDWWQEAQKASTIPYEILTSLSDRVERIYR